ncbi:hypothetical protein Tco_0312705 [Tanacetum coccineum]
MLKRCEDTNLSLNWEKSHFMVKEGIVLGHKISKSGLEVDRAKVEVIAKLPHPTTVKGVRSFLGHILPIYSLNSDTNPLIHSKEKLTDAPILIAPERTGTCPLKLMCDAMLSTSHLGQVPRAKKKQAFSTLYT